jgi:hypothetical protein
LVITDRSEGKNSVYVKNEYAKEKIVSQPLRNKGGRTYNYRKPGDDS